jgi:hypothetical protein
VILHSSPAAPWPRKPAARSTEVNTRACSENGGTKSLRPAGTGRGPGGDRGGAANLLRAPTVRVDLVRKRLEPGHQTGLSPVFVEFEQQVRFTT